MLPCMSVMMAPNVCAWMDITKMLVSVHSALLAARHAILAQHVQHVKVILLLKVGFASVRMMANGLILILAAKYVLILCLSV